MQVVVYTDSSHCRHTKIAACSFAVIINDILRRHQVVVFDNIETNGIGEIIAATEALQYVFLMKEVSTILLYTDYEPIVTFKVRAESRNKFFTTLRETLEIIRAYGIPVELKYIKAHKGNNFNSLVDRSARQHLRKYLSNNKQKQQ